MNTTNKEAESIVESFAELCSSTIPAFEIVEKGGEKFLEIYVGSITENLLDKIKSVKIHNPNNSLCNNTYLVEKKIDNWLESIEVDILQNIISESLTIGRGSLKSDFYKKFIPSVGGEEKRITSKTNNIVYGRRGAGKSSLILYGCNKVIESNQPFAWIALQQYHNRTDLLVIPQILYEIVNQLFNTIEHIESKSKTLSIIDKLEKKGTSITFTDIKMNLPLISRYITPIARSHGAIFIFLDDLHLIGRNIQPLVLSSLYSFCRGNDIFLKISSIENLTYLYDYTKKEGLEIPGDLQSVALDYNLMTPEKTFQHINDIILSYIKYSGIPSLGQLCDVRARQRLTWVSAGVPRDALYIFNNAITQAKNQRRKKIAVVDINMAASESMAEKEKYITDDIEDDPNLLRESLDEIKSFCFNDSKMNAFLVHKDPSNKKYKIIRKLIDLRFLHILHPGITPDRRNEKFEALLLDYAFYTGFRRNPSVKEFKATLELTTAKELRNLRKFKI